MAGNTHPIRIAASRSGLTPDVLRAWEKRYSAVKPQREDGRRLYSEDDIERLILLRRVTLAGRRIGDVAGLTSDQLRQLDKADEQALAAAPRTTKASQPPRTHAPFSSDPQGFRSACLQAVCNFDGERLKSLLEQAAVAVGQVKLLDEVVLPVLQDVGEMWRQGEMRIAQEHLATEVLQGFLTGLRTAQAHDEAAPRIVVTTLPGQHHELGAMIVAATAASEGWNVIYVGPNLPTEEIAAAVLGLEARAVALSLVYPADDPHMGEQIESLRRHVGDEVLMLVGGSAAAGLDASLQASGAVRLRDMVSLRALLASLRMQPASKS